MAEFDLKGFDCRAFFKLINNNYHSDRFQTKIPSNIVPIPIIKRRIVGVKEPVSKSAELVAVCVGIAAKVSLGTGDKVGDNVGVNVDNGELVGLFVGLLVGLFVGVADADASNAGPSAAITTKDFTND